MQQYMQTNESKHAVLVQNVPPATSSTVCIRDSRDFGCTCSISTEVALHKATLATQHPAHVLQVLRRFADGRGRRKLTLKREGQRASLAPHLPLTCRAAAFAQAQEVLLGETLMRKAHIQPSGKALCCGCTEQQVYLGTACSKSLSFSLD